MFLLKWSDIQGSLDYSIRAQSQKDIRWISPADNHDFCQDEGYKHERIHIFCFVNRSQILHLSETY